MRSKSRFGILFEIQSTEILIIKCQVCTNCRILTFKCHATSRFPTGRVVEIGTQVNIQNTLQFPGQLSRGYANGQARIPGHADNSRRRGNCVPARWHFSPCYADSRLALLSCHKASNSLIYPGRRCETGDRSHLMQHNHHIDRQSARHDNHYYSFGYPRRSSPCSGRVSDRRSRADQLPGSTINSPTIAGWWVPHRKGNTPVLSAVNVTVVSSPRLTVKLTS
ncbi:hypothetical protein DEV91_1524 [Phyllobacterium brassicacearum]|nr:hypothetical protein DEV91_1524 [Phyllobacterium brassicacearum]